MSTSLRSMSHRRRLRHLGRLGLVAAALAQWPASPASAAVFNFTGAASGSWAAAGNWAEGVPLGAADTEIVLDAAARPSSFNDIAGGLVLNRLTLGAAVAAPVLSGQALNFQGSNPVLAMLGTNGHAQVQTALLLGGTLAVQGGASLASQLFLQGAVSGSNAGAGLNLVSGIAVLSGNNTFTGLTSVAAGAALGVAGSGLAATQGVSVAAGGELQIVSANVATTLAVPIQLAGTLSSSAKRINGLFGPVGSAFVQGAVTLTADAALVALGASGTGLNSTAFAVNGPIARAGQTLTLATTGVNNELNVSGNITGAGALVIVPAGGRISVGSVGGGDLRVQGSAGAVVLGTVSGDGAVRVAYDSDFGSVNINGVVSGARDIEVARGSLTLANASNSFVGTLLLRTEGGLSIGREAMLGNAANTLRFDGGGLLRLTDATGNLGRAVFTTAGTGTLDLGTNRSRSVSGPISGDGGFTFSGSGSLLSLTGNNSFAGGLGIDGPVVVFSVDANLGAAGAPVRVQAGSLALPSGYDLQRPLGVGSATASVSGTDNHMLGGNITGAGRLNLGGPARFTLAGSNTHAGGVALAGSVGTPAVLVLDSDDRLGLANGVLNIGRQNGFFVLPGRLEAAADLSIAATRSTTFRDMTVDTAGRTVVFNQPIAGLGMTKTGAGLWLLNTANTDASNTNLVAVEQGTLRLGVADALGSRAVVTVAPGAVLDLNSRSQSLQNLQVGAGGLVQLGAGASTLLSLPAGGVVNGSIHGQGDIAVSRAGSSFNNVVLELNAGNSFSGNLLVNSGGRLSLGHAQALGAAGNVLRLDNGVLAANGSSATPIVLGASQALQIGSGGAGFMAAGQSLVIERQLSGNLPLRFMGGSSPGDAAKTEVRLMAASNDFVHDLQLGDARSFGNATLGITADGALGAAGNRVLLGNTFFDGESTRSSSGGLRAFASFTLPASRSVVLGGGSGDAFSGFIDTNGFSVVLQGGIAQASAGLSFVKAGAGTLVMNGNNSYTGRTRVDEGTLGGSGEVQSLDLADAAALAPGESAGLLRVRTDLSLGAGLLQMELGGTQRGSTYDALDVGGTALIGGALLWLNFIGGFDTAVQGSQQFELLNAAAGIFGSFANVADGERLATAGGQGSFLVRYGNGLGLVISDYVAAVPEPGSWALMALGLLGLAASAGRRPAVWRNCAGASVGG